MLVDANVLVYAHVSNFDQHEEARSWLDEQLNADRRLGLPWESLTAFVRLVTNPRVFTEPEPVGDAWQQVEDWLQRPGAWIPGPTDRHREVFGALIAETKPTASLVPDAHLAAIALQHGLAVASTDADFARFPTVRWIDPLRS
jgi:uncharacterized protein